MYVIARIVARQHSETGEAIPFTVGPASSVELTPSRHEATICLMRLVALITYTDDDQLDALRAELSEWDANKGPYICESEAEAVVAWKVD